jgi:hypothetical protein
MLYVQQRDPLKLPNAYPVNAAQQPSIDQDARG